MASTILLASVPKTYIYCPYFDFDLGQPLLVIHPSVSGRMHSPVKSTITIAHHVIGPPPLPPPLLRTTYM